jgi:transposase
MIMSLEMTAVAGVQDAGRMEDLPDPEVAARAVKRTFTAAYKKKILAEYESTARGDRSALLRREKLYSSLIGKWQAQAAAGSAEPFAAKKPGPKPDTAAKELAALRAVNERLEAELAQSRKVIDVQAKLSALLEDLSRSADTGKKPNA